jgi:hypothetical protein
MAGPLDKDSVEMAIEVTKACAQSAQNVMMDKPEMVAAFIEAIAAKIEELKYGPNRP